MIRFLIVTTNTNLNGIIDFSTKGFVLHFWEAGMSCMSCTSQAALRGRSVNSRYQSKETECLFLEQKIKNWFFAMAYCSFYWSYFWFCTSDVGKDGK